MPLISREGFYGLNFRRLRFWTRRSPKNNPDVTPALQLPPELVGHIMTIVVQNQFLTYSRTLPRSSRYTWIKLCHICQCWRQIALGCPMLWSYIDTRWDALVKQLILRSHTAPLTVFVWFTNASTHSVIDNILGEMHRIKELHLVGNKLDLILPRLRLPLKAPFLEVLTLECLYQSSMPAMPRLLEISENSTNYLTSLTLAGITTGTIPSDPGILSCLQYLRIFPKTSGITPLSEIITVLTFCPELIEFHYSAPSNVIGYSDGETRTVNLRHLRRLRISTNNTASILVLNYLTVPPDISLYISAIYGSNVPQPLVIPTTYLTTYNSLIVHTSTPIRLKAEVLSPATSEHRGHDRTYTPNMLEMKINALAFDTIPTILSGLLPQLRHVELKELTEFRHEESCRLFLMSLHCVESLKASCKSGGPAKTLISELSESANGLLCPSLHILSLQFVMLEPRVDVFFGALASLLRNRNDSLARLTMLDLSGCSGIPSDHIQIDIMRSLVELLILPE
ncbi:hypothetical protein BD410DRAFT_830304 [Rickenella mellea]|uniref:Uncharacterized protein n=1 Tax=Rickenella mellea TaxID=50990 RepID=A0A4Y7PVS5_9AGAM|nr:hypothetical protein BD410DRAFT_830304 [Rickenella mellea]